MKRASIVVLLLAFGIANARAQTPLHLTLDDAITRGLETSHRVAEIEARQDAARAVEGQRRAASMPRVQSWRGQPASTPRRSPRRRWSR